MGHHNEIDTAQGIKFAFWLNLIFSIIEITGGIYTNSTAILADAFHDFMDVLAIGLAYILERYAQKPQDYKYTFGYKRFSVLSAVIVSFVLATGSIFMIREAIITFRQPKELHTVGMLLLALLGIAANGLAFLKIKQEGKKIHSLQQQAHGDTVVEAPTKKHHHANPNSQAIMLHLLEDVLGWVAVLVGSVIIYFTHWIWIDSLLTMGIAGFILFNAIKNLCSSAKIFLQASPDHLTINELESTLKNYPEIATVVNLRVWSLDGMEPIASTQLAINDKATDQVELLHKLKSTFFLYKIKDVTIQIEQAAS